MEFSKLKLSEHLLQVVSELGYKKLTPIQAESIPYLLEGRDLIGQSKTGSGKTASFSLPLLERLSAERELQGLVLCPTRELCTQVAREIRKLGRRMPGLQVLILSGGMPMPPQIAALRKGVHIVVGTPGRVLDHIRRGSIDLRAVSYLVLDEADRMLDMGFEEDMNEILRDIPEERQTVFFSATFPDSIEEMSERYQNQPVRVTIESAPEEAPDIYQVAYTCAGDKEKFNAILYFLQEFNPESAIIFCNLKITVADLADALADAGVSSAALHGDLDQTARDRVMAKFRNRSVRVLIATDVAARGIDVENLDLVVNYDMPKPDIYVHRIGRTGRAGKKGMAISLALPKEEYKIKTIQQFTGVEIEREEVPEVEMAPVAKEAAMETLYISGGRKDKMRPGDILGALTGEAGGLPGKDIGKIEIHDRFSYVAVSRPVAELAVERLRNGKIKGRKFRIEIVKS